MTQLPAHRRKGVIMFRATEAQLSEALTTAKKLSRHYSVKFPEVDYDEFYSISLIAIAEALRTYRKKGTLNYWCARYIYSRFYDYLRKEKKKNCLLLRIPIWRPET
jgi:DNA-directed RNA polymerase specialized sigma24 family protein